MDMSSLSHAGTTAAVGPTLGYPNFFATNLIRIRGGTVERTEIPPEGLGCLPPRPGAPGSDLH
jgi:hypothetical protein